MLEPPVPLTAVLTSLRSSRLIRLGSSSFGKPVEYSVPFCCVTSSVLSLVLIVTSSIWPRSTC